MRTHLMRLAILPAGLVLTFSAATGQQTTTPPAQQDPYVVGRAMPPLDPGRTMVSMTLAQAIERALQSNLALQTARLDPAIQEYAVDAARAAFSPVVSATVGYNNATNQSTSQLDGGARTTSERTTFNSSVAKTFPWSGGRLVANFNNNRTETNNSFATRNPSYSSQLSFNYTQPLLAGLQIDNQRAALESQVILSGIVDLELRGQIENVTHQVKEAYWDLRTAIEQIEIQRRSLAEAEQLLADTRLQVRLGRMVELQAAQAEAQVAAAQQSLLNAEIVWRNQELGLKQLLLSGADDPLLNQTVNPVDLPELTAQEVDLRAAVDTALRSRMDIRRARQQQEVTLLNLKVSRSNAMPDLNLSAGYALAGVGGNLFNRSGLGGAPVLINAGGYRQGLESIIYFETPTWNLQLNGSYPIGNNPGKIDLERARLQLRQSELALKTQELGIITEVTAAGLAVRNSFLQVEAARKSREASERNLAGERTRLSVGLGRPFEVVTAQNAVTSARLAELRAIMTHMNALANFERVKRVGN
ncbi:MAG: TolC family protein [Gemmatimonadota bacterium]